MRGGYKPIELCGGDPLEELLVYVSATDDYANASMLEASWVLHEGGNTDGAGALDYLVLAEKHETDCVDDRSLPDIDPAVYEALAD